MSGTRTRNEGGRTAVTSAARKKTEKKVPERGRRRKCERRGRARVVVNCARKTGGRWCESTRGFIEKTGATRARDNGVYLCTHYRLCFFSLFSSKASGIGLLCTHDELHEHVEMEARRPLLFRARSTRVVIAAITQVRIQD